MIDKKALKQRAEAQIEIVEAVLRRYDPLGVSPGVCAPADEYDSYAPHVVSMIVRGCTVQELADHLSGLCAADTSAPLPLSLAEQLINAVLQVSQQRPS